MTFAARACWFAVFVRIGARKVRVAVGFAVASLAIESEPKVNHRRGPTQHFSAERKFSAHFSLPSLGLATAPHPFFRRPYELLALFVLPIAPQDTKMATPAAAHRLMPTRPRRHASSMVPR